MNTTQPQDTDTYAPQVEAGQTDAPQLGTGPADPTPPAYDYSPDRPALRRPFQGRMLAGVAEGVSRYFGIDPTLVRIGFVVLTVVGGAGVPLYLAGLLLIPDEDSNQSIAASIIESLQNRNR